MSTMVNINNILRQWEDENKAKVRKYVTDHKWLRSDIEKLYKHARDDRLATLAITRTMVIGRGVCGGTSVVSRAALGIGDNYE